MHPAQLSIDDLLAECEVKRTRGSGPGGQHRNKVETAVVVTHLPTSMRGEASERRSLERNRQQAITRLRVKLALNVRLEPLDELSERWKSRVVGRRISVSASHEDFPALLAEVLDWLNANEYSVSAAAQWHDLSTSQLVKFLKVEPDALASVNCERTLRGESQLR